MLFPGPSEVNRAQLGQVAPFDGHSEVDPLARRRFAASANYRVADPRLV